MGKKINFQILLSKKSMFFITLFMFGLFSVSGQNSTISGTVTDNLGQPLPGVNVIVKGTSTGVSTDFDGLYSLETSTADILVFSFLGFDTQEIAVNGEQTINVTMIEATGLLDEVVVVGYGETSRLTLTGAVSSVKGVELIKSPQPNLSGSFAGRLSGVVVLNRSGEPGFDGSDIRIRGVSTTGNNDPLIVVDGIANRLGGMNRIDPNDIESVSVLKDASAAIYGAQAANGVILITTKKGKTGKPVLSFTFNQGFVQPTKLADMAGSPTYGEMINEINYYRNPSGGLNQIYSDAELELFANGSDPDNYPNTNWVDSTIKSVAFQNNQNLSIRGGSESVSYFASVSRVHQESIFENGITSYDQYSIRSNTDFNITKNLRVGLDISLRKEDRLYPTTVLEIYLELFIELIQLFL